MTYKLSEYLEISRLYGKLVVNCSKCKEVLCDADKHWKDSALHLTVPLSKAGYRRSQSGRFVMRQYICPKCATILDVEVTLPEDGPLYDDLDISTIPREMIA